MSYEVGHCFAAYDVEGIRIIDRKYEDRFKGFVCHGCNVQHTFPFLSIKGLDQRGCWRCNNRKRHEFRSASLHEVNQQLSSKDSKKPKTVNPLRDLMCEKEEALEQPHGQGVYVLKLDDGYVYVGRSTEIPTRIGQHQRGAGSRWCKMHGTKHTQTLKTQTPPQPDLSLWELKETLYQMMFHGVNKVRGYMWVQPQLSTTDLLVIKSLLMEEADLCRKCGRTGHYMGSCKETTSAKWLTEINSPHPSDNNQGDTLVSELKSYRHREASRRNIQAYCIFTNQTMEAIAAACPQTTSALLSIHGIGKRKLEAYGSDILSICKRHRKTM